jgi:hypothetical protein
MGEVGRVPVIEVGEEKTYSGLARKLERVDH